MVMYHLEGEEPSRTSHARGWSHYHIDEGLEGVLVAPLCFDWAIDSRSDGVAVVRKGCRAIGLGQMRQMRDWLCGGCHDEVFLLWMPGSLGC
jgi:hypothetical protein